MIADCASLFQGERAEGNWIALAAALAPDAVAFPGITYEATGF